VQGRSQFGGGYFLALGQLGVGLHQTAHSFAVTQNGESLYQRIKLSYDHQARWRTL
jgi:hypothetical protein